MKNILNQKFFSKLEKYKYFFTFFQPRTKKHRYAYPQNLAEAAPVHSPCTAWAR